MRQFCDQLDFLRAEGYVTPTMREVAAAATSRNWPKRTAVITFDDGYADNLAACGELEKRGMRATWFIVSGSIGREPTWASDGRPSGRLLSGPELRDMHVTGMEIGSHTVNHVRLTQSTPDELDWELVQSKSTLEDLLGTSVTSFAYPYGAWDERCARAAQTAGYQAACTTDTGWALRDRNPYRLRRLTIFNSDTTSTLARKLLFASNDVSWATLSRHHLRQARSKFGLSTP
jgi:peptidoglycan/xylan/chitin deacetylase (PgdA/CDA1 family)